MGLNDFLHVLTNAAVIKSQHIPRLRIEPDCWVRSVNANSVARVMLILSFGTKQGTDTGQPSHLPICTASIDRAVPGSIPGATSATLVKQPPSLIDLKIVQIFPTVRNHWFGLSAI